MNYKILINKNAVPVLIEASNNADPDTWFSLEDEFHHIRFKDEEQVRNLLSPEEFRLHRIGQTFPLPTGYKVSFEYQVRENESVKWSEVSKSIYNTLKGFQKQMVAILSKLEEPKQDNICEHCGKLYCDNFLKHNSCGEMPDWTSLAYEPDHEFFNNWPTPIKEQAKLEHKKILRDYTNFLSSMDYFGKPASNPVKGYVGEYLDKIKVVAPSEEVKQGWISVKDLPNKLMRVRYKMIDGKEDVGYFDNGQFYTFDPISYEEISFWQPLE